MRVGDLVRMLGHPGIIAPLTEPGRLMGARIKLPLKVVSMGVIVERAEVDDDVWWKAVFPEGVGWIQDGWCEVVE